MKKDTFLKGALISTFCIVFSKILGIIYVIPFYAIIGTNGRALYGYAYNMYTLFLNFSTVGIPLAVSKLVSEYHTLGYENVKERTYKLALKVTLITAVLSSIALFVFAPTIAHSIIGDIQGGSSKEDIAFVLRIASTAIVFVTILSGMRGYLQGHKFISVSSISQVIEQFIRIIVIIAGSFVAVKLWGTKEAVGVAVFGATVGGIAALIYLGKHMRAYRKSEPKTKIKEEEKNITTKHIFKQIITYTIPFIIVSIAVSLYNTIDMFTIVKALVQYGSMAIEESEMVLSVVSTWGAKLNSIVTSVAAGVIVAVLPNVASDYVKSNKAEVSNKINKTLQVVIYFILPMVCGLSFLATPVWKVFYGTNELGVSVFSYSIFTALFYSIFLNVNTIMQSVNRHKIANISIIIGIILKLTLTVPFIMLFSKIDFIPTYYGSITATILAYLIPILICLIDLKKNRSVNFKDTIYKIGYCLFACLVMLGILFLLKTIFPISGNKIYSFVVIGVYALLGAGIYLYLTNKFNIFQSIFECNPKELINRKLKKKKI